MYPPAPGADPTMLRASTTGRFQTLIDDARQQSLEEVTPDAVDRVFYKLPVRKRIVVMLGGPTMNLILAFVLFTIVLCGIGIQTATTTRRRRRALRPDRHQPRGRAQRQRHLRPVDADARRRRRPARRRHDPLVRRHAGDHVGGGAGRDQGRARRRRPRRGRARRPRGHAHRPAGAHRASGLRRATASPPAQTEHAQLRRHRAGARAPDGARLDRARATSGTSPRASVQKIVTLPVRMWDLMRQTFTYEPRDRDGIVGIVGVGPHHRRGRGAGEHAGRSTRPRSCSACSPG